jgi:hypothetical protein
VVYPVDLDALRARLPDNLYWQLGAPTDDPAVLARRAEIEESNNKLFGKVQSGAASPEEIERYYDQRHRVSEDYIEFAALLLSEHEKELPEQDRGLYELSIRMHRSRLDDEPRLRREALARYEVAEQRRAEHRRKEKAN